MKISEKIQADIVMAMKARDEHRLTTLRMVKTTLRMVKLALENKQIDKREALTNAEETQILTTLIKARTGRRSDGNIDGLSLLCAPCLRTACPPDSLHCSACLFLSQSWCCRPNQRKPCASQAGACPVLSPAGVHRCHLCYRCYRSDRNSGYRRNQDSNGSGAAGKPRGYRVSAPARMVLPTGTGGECDRAIWFLQRPPNRPFEQADGRREPRKVSCPTTPTS
jgi:hypothetical protein